MLIQFHCTKKSSFEQQQMEVVHLYDNCPKLRKTHFYCEYASTALWKQKPHKTFDQLRSLLSSVGRLYLCAAKEIVGQLLEHSTQELWIGPKMQDWGV